MAVNVDVYRREDNGDLRIIINNGDEYINLIFGRDDYFWGGTSNGSGYAYDNVATYIANTLNDWIAR